MAASLEARIAPDRGIEQAIIALKKGAHLLKCGSRGKPKFCPFRLSQDEKMLIWYSEEKEKHLNLSLVSNVVLGQKTVNFLKQRKSEKESQSLSLIYNNGESSLDLICKDKEQAESWYLGLTTLISACYHHHKPLSDLRNYNLHTNSCINSPASFIRKKHQLATLHNPVKFSQVRSLYGSPRCTQSQCFSDGILDSSSEIFFSPRLRTRSDIESYLEKFIPHLPYKVTNNSFKNMVHTDVTKDKRIPPLAPKVKLIDHECFSVEKNDNLKDIFMWGDVPGEILDRGQVLKMDPTLPRLLDSVKTIEINRISCGEKHAALITKQGEVFCWGEEKGGRLGHKTYIDVSNPKIIESLANINISNISFGSKHTCAVTTSGELYEWGESSHGNKEISWFPHRICGGPLDSISILKVACGEWHTAIISASGQLFTYGDGTFGVLGHGDTKSFSKPKEVESLKGLRVKSVACGPWHTSAVIEIIIGKFKTNTPAGKLFTWGDSDGGRLGHADRERKLLPTCVASLVDCDFVQVSCSATVTVALTVTGVVFTIGSAVHGQLGNPRAEDVSITSVEGLLKTQFVKEIASGYSHVAVLTTNGKIFTWGKGTDGQLGLGDYSNRSSPALVEALVDRQVESISCGSNFTAVICLHKSVTSKDQSVCTGCRTVFGFTKKKHNCYNCGSVFCHSCSSNKALSAALASDRTKRYRVCDRCFNQLGNLLEGSVNNPKPLSELKTNREDSILNEIRAYTPKLSRIFKETNLVEQKLRNVKSMEHKKHEPVFAKRWGQVECPKQFTKWTRENSSFHSKPKQQDFSQSPVHMVNGSSLLKSVLTDSSAIKQDLNLMDKIMCEEVKRLYAEARNLAEQCQQKSMKIQQYKRRIEEAWSFARDEAAKCKAEKEIIRVLTNQKHTLSEKLSVERHMHCAESLSCDNSTGELGSKSVKSSGGDEGMEQIERGVYATFVVLPGGKKGLRRMKFSRKLFSEEAAQRWWRENSNNLSLKYNIEQLVT